VPKSPPTRWGLAALAAVLLLSGSAVYLHLRGAGSAVTAAAAGRTLLARDLARPPWYGLDILHGAPSFHEPAAPATSQPNVPAVAGILVDVDTDQILWERNSHQRLSPASTMKLLSALVAMNNFDAQRSVTVTPDALFQAGDESKMFLKAGQTLSVRELLTGMLTVSANDAADVLAIDTVGMERFVGAMNAQARALGLRDTHATSPVGLDDPAMYSSAYDLAVLAALDEERYPLFSEIVRSRFTFLPATATHPNFYLDNINLLLSMYPAAVGIKTGYTGDAGACEVGMAVRDGHRLLSVVLHGQLVYSETRRLLDWGFEQEGLPSQLPSPSVNPSPSPKS
jgi:serine-type D-Ala-D-Ala carboxypeptidase (penicillin-binding protein 5/6)